MHVGRCWCHSSKGHSEDRPAQGMPCPLLYLQTATCVQGHVPVSSEPPPLAANSHRCQVPATVCPGAPPGVHTQAAVPVGTWACVLMVACPAVARHRASRSVWRQEHHGDPQHDGWSHLPQQAKYPPSKSSHSAPQEQCKGYSFWRHFWQHWGEGVGAQKHMNEEDMVACLAPVSTALCPSCWSCSCLCSGLQKINSRGFMIFYYVWKEWCARKILMCLCLDRQECRKTNYNKYL